MEIRTPHPNAPQCAKCRGFESCTNPCIGRRGSPTPTVLFVGEAPGGDEDATGQPFVGKAGQLLDSIIAQVPELGSFALTNCVRCRPPGNKLQGHEIAACRQYLLDEILELKPKLLVLLGNSPLQSVLGQRGVTKMRGRTTTWTHPDDPTFTCRVLVTLHPASTFYDDGAAKLKMIAEDIASIPRVLAAPVVTAEEQGRRRVLCMSRDQVMWALRHCREADDVVAFDTETGSDGLGGLVPWRGVKVLCLSLAWNSRCGVTIPLDHSESPFREGAEREWLVGQLREFFRTRPRLVGHNAKYDVEHISVDVFNSDPEMCSLLIDSVYADTMLAAHALDESAPRSLEHEARACTSIGKYDGGLDQYLRANAAELKVSENGYAKVPWEHLGPYSCDDALITYLVWQVRSKQLYSQGFREFYHQHYMRILRTTIRMRLNGAYIDQKQVDANELHYKGLVSDGMAKLAGNDYVLLTEALLVSRLLNDRPNASDKLDEWLAANPQAQAVADKVSVGGALQDAMRHVVIYHEYGFSALGKKPTWVFSPGSPKKLASLLYEVACIPVVHLTKKRRPAVDKMALAAIAVDDGTPDDLRDLLAVREVVGPDGKKVKTTGAIVQVKMAAKSLSTYVYPYRNLVDAASYLRCNFLCAGGSWRDESEGGTRTGRLSSEMPNLQNVPHDPRITSCFKSRFPGGYIIEADYSQLELRILAGLSKDRAMGDAFRSGVDVHAYTVQLMYGIPIAAVAKDSFERKSCKIIGFGIVYGMGDESLAVKLGVERDIAKELIEKWLGTFPEAKEYIEAQKLWAEKHGYVLNPFGRRRWVREAMAKGRNMDRETKMLKSAALRIAVNTPIQGCGADICNIAMHRIDNSYRAAGMRSLVILQVHDAVFMDVPADELQEAIRIATAHFTRPYPWMHGVPLDVEWKVGKSWGEFDQDLMGRVIPKRSEVAAYDAEEDREIKRALLTVPEEDSDDEEADS